MHVQSGSEHGQRRTIKMQALAHGRDLNTFALQKEVKNNSTTSDCLAKVR